MSFLLAKYIQFQVKLKWEIDKHWGSEHSTRSNLYHILSLWFVWDLRKCLDFLQQVTVSNWSEKTGAAWLNWITRTKSVMSIFIGTNVTGIRCVFEAYPRWVGLKHHVPPFLREILTYPVMQGLPMTRHVRHASRTWNCESFEKSSETM